MALVTGKCIAARGIEPGERLTSTFLRVAGVGTESEPLRLAAVFRHADIADESHPAERIIQTNRCIEVLDTTLAQVEVDGASSSDIAFRLKQVLEAANSIATV